METAFSSDERFTRAEFFRWVDSRPVEDTNHYELLDEHIVMTPPANAGHGMVAARIIRELMNRSLEIGDGKVLASCAGYELPSGDVVEPDASFISAATLSRGSRLDPDKVSTHVPDVVVEVLSPSTSRRDRIVKKRIYAKNGVAEYWIVDARMRRVTLYRLEGADYGAPAELDSGTISSTVLAGLSIPLARIFEDLD